MEKNFTFKVLYKFEEKLEQDWKSLENEVKQFFFQKFINLNTQHSFSSSAQINISNTNCFYFKIINFCFFFKVYSYPY